MNQEIELKLKNILSKNVDDQNLLLTLGMDGDLTQLGINSVTFIKIIVEVEEEFGISFSDEDLNINKFRTLGDISNYIAGKC